MTQMKQVEVRSVVRMHADKIAHIAAIDNMALGERERSEITKSAQRILELLEDAVDKALRDGYQPHGSRSGRAVPSEKADPEQRLEMYPGKFANVTKGEPRWDRPDDGNAVEEGHDPS